VGGDGGAGFGERLEGGRHGRGDLDPVGVCHEVEVRLVGWGGLLEAGEELDVGFQARGGAQEEIARVGAAEGHADCLLAALHAAQEFGQAGFTTDGAAFLFFHVDDVDLLRARGEIVARGIVGVAQPVVAGLEEEVHALQGEMEFVAEL